MVCLAGMSFSRLALVALILLTLAAVSALGFLLAAARERRFAPWPTLLFLAAILLLPSTAAVRTRSLGVEACAARLRSLGAALELYGWNYGLHYPERLELLVPDYFEELPYCPVARHSTGGTEELNPYLEGYERNPQGGYFTVRCAGSHHRGMGGAPPGFPYYSSERGLVLSP